MAEIAYAGVGEEHLQDQKNREEVSPGELCRGGMRNPIIVDVYTTRHLVHSGYVRGSVEDALGNLFVSYSLWKDKIPLTHRRSSKYDARQEI